MLPFKCPSMMFPISGLKSPGNSQNLHELEKKFLSGTKLSVSRSRDTEFEKWIAYLAYNHHFILYMWKPSSGELKQIDLIPGLKIFADEEDKTVIIHAVDDNGTAVQTIMQSDSLTESSSLYEFLVRARDFDPAAVPSSQEPPPSQESTLSLRYSDGTVMSPEDLERHQKRQALASLSMRQPSWKGSAPPPRSGKAAPPSVSLQKSTSQDGSSSAGRASLVSRLSNVFGNVGEDGCDDCNEFERGEG